MGCPRPVMGGYARAEGVGRLMMINRRGSGVGLEIDVYSDPLYRQSKPWRDRSSFHVAPTSLTLRTSHQVEPLEISLFYLC